jgi:hypothetical protein
MALHKEFQLDNKKWVLDHLGILKEKKLM